MSHYVIESGVRAPEGQRMWTVISQGIPDAEIAFHDMWAYALSLPVMYRPDGGRKLRVRKVER